MHTISSYQVDTEFEIGRLITDGKPQQIIQCENLRGPTVVFLNEANQQPRHLIESLEFWTSL